MRIPPRLLPSSDNPRAVAAAIVLLLVLAYWRVVACGFIWDDDDYVTNNPVLRSWGGLARIWFEPNSLPQYYPLVHTSFWLEYRLWGLHPLGYHLDNVAMHGLAAWLFYRLLVTLRVPGAAFAALWFVVHPVHVESVAWITERKNVLSLVLCLWAARRWLAWHDRGRRFDYGIASCAFVMALLAKTVVATLPAALCVLLWWRDGRVGRRAWLGVLPWLLLGAAMGAMTAHLESTHVGASEMSWQLVGLERVLVAGRAVWFYLACLLWPFGLCFNYPRWQLDPGSWAQWLPVVAAMVVVGGAFGMRHRIGRAPLAVLLLYGGSLLPALGFFDVYPFRYSYVADHFQYHASLAVIAAVAAVAATRLGTRLPWLAVPVLLVCALTSQGAVANYRDFETLFRAVLRDNPRSALALANLGAMANQRGDAIVAKDLLERCLEIDPGNHEAIVNLGVLAHRAGDRVTARSRYEQALRIKHDDVHAENNLAVWHLEANDPEAALPLVRAAITTDPEYLDGHATLAWTLCALQRWADALPELDYVLQRRATDIASRQRAVACLFALGRDRPGTANALVWLRQQPGDVEATHQVEQGLARVLAVGDAASARRDAETICRNAGVDPGNLLPGLADELERRGAAAHAACVRAQAR